jgi:hypothetical protein
LSQRRSDVSERDAFIAVSPQSDKSLILLQFC